VTPNDHAFELGRVLSNLQGLEFLLRGCLSYWIPAESVPQQQKSGDIYSVPVGSRVPLSPVTGYQTLGELIDLFNKHRPAGSPELGKEAVALRDALAHGRVSSAAENEQMRLVKFSRPLPPTFKEVEVTYNVVMTPEWFGEQRALVFAAMQLVLAVTPFAHQKW
jgi:hypothetical protein